MEVKQNKKNCYFQYFHFAISSPHVPVTSDQFLYPLIQIKNIIMLCPYYYAAQIILLKLKFH